MKIKKGEYIINQVSGKQLKVIIADDELFVACPVYKKISENVEHVDFDKAEVYSNDEAILKDTPIQKITPYSIGS